MGLDGISLPLMALTLLVVPLCIIYSWNHLPDPGKPKAFFTLLLILETGMVGTFLAQDLILFFVFFEVVLLPMYFMIGVWGGPNRQYAAIKFFLFTLFGSALMLVSFLALYFLSDVGTFDIRVLPDAAQGIASTTQLWIFGGMFLGFGIKVPMFPFHTWLPDAHTEAPTVGSVILAAVLLKLGTYGFIRIAIPILPEAAKDWAPYIGLLAVIGIIYGALGCLAQTDMKRLIAFSSVAHMGFVMLGIATLTDIGLQRRHLRHGRPRPHHRDALLLRRLGEGPLPHPGDQAASAACSPRCPTWAGSSASAPWPASACPAWPGSGASSRRSCRPTSPAPKACRWRPSGPTWSSPPSAPSWPRATCCGSTSAPRSACPVRSSPTRRSPG